MAFHATRGRLKSSAVHSPRSRNISAMKACAPYSGMTNCTQNEAHLATTSKGIEKTTDLVEFVAEIDGVYVVALQIRVHDDLRMKW